MNPECSDPEKRKNVKPKKLIYSVVTLPLFNRLLVLISVAFCKINAVQRTNGFQRKKGVCKSASSGQVQLGDKKRLC